MKIKSIIVTCEKYHDSRVKSIEETWGKDIETIFLSDINDNDKFIGFPELPTGYENLWMKFAKFFMSFNFTDDWYLICDDDTFINVDNIKKLAKKENQDNPICFGFMCYLKEGALDEFNNYTGFPLQSISGHQTNLPIVYPSGGAGFLINKSAVIRIQNYLNSLSRIGISIPQAYNSDVAIGFWIRNSNVEFVKVDGFCPQNPENMEHEYSQIPKSYTYHYITPERMYELKKIINEEV